VDSTDADHTHSDRLNVSDGKSSNLGMSDRMTDLANRQTVRTCVTEKARDTCLSERVTDLDNRQTVRTCVTEKART
jgi:hypothetical protein